MRMTEMDLYLADRGFAVDREYNSRDDSYSFKITKHGISETGYWKYPAGFNAQAVRADQIRFLDGLIERFNKKIVNGVYGVHAIDTDTLYPRMIIPYGSFYTGRRVPNITKVIFNDPATIVFWADNTKTVVKATDENFDKEKGLAMAIAKKALGNQGNYFNEFKKWLKEDEV